MTSMMPKMTNADVPGMASDTKPMNCDMPGSHCPTGDHGIDQTMQSVHDSMMKGGGMVPSDNTKKMPPHGGRTANRMP